MHGLRSRSTDVILVISVIVLALHCTARADARPAYACLLVSISEHAKGKFHCCGPLMFLFIPSGVV